MNEWNNFNASSLMHHEHVYTICFHFSTVWLEVLTPFKRHFVIHRFIPHTPIAIKPIENGTLYSCRMACIYRFMNACITIT